MVVESRDTKRTLGTERTPGALPTTWLMLVRLTRRSPQMVVGGLMVGLFLVLAVGSSYVAPFPYDMPDLDDTWARPSRVHPFGTDHIGRDILSRVMYGTRISLSVAFGAVFISILIGIPVGILSGYLGHKVDLVLMRIVDIVLAFPSLLLMILLAVGLGSGILSMILAIGLSRWASLARIVRGELLRLVGTEFIVSARALGATDFRIVYRHILPNTLSAIIVFSTFAVPFSIMSEAGLGFVGIGVQPPTPSWGVLLNTGFSSFRSFPGAILAPSLAIALCMLAFVLLGNGLRDALDPRLSRQHER